MTMFEHFATSFLIAGVVSSVLFYLIARGGADT